MGRQRRRKRRSFSPEFKAETVRLVQGSEKSLGTIARELDLTETALRAWVRQAEIDAGRGRAGVLTTEEREELARLRRDVKRLQMERDILKNGPGAGPLPAGPETPGAVRTVSAPEERPTAFWSTRAR
jgi:transposase